MSRSELAEAVNAFIYETTSRVYALDAHYVGRLERGVRRWPNADYRAGFRAVLGVGSDAGLGFGLHREYEQGGRETDLAPDGAAHYRSPGAAELIREPDVIVMMACDGLQVVTAVVWSCRARTRPPLGSPQLTHLSDPPKRATKAS